MSGYSALEGLYQVRETIGTGGFSTVKLGLHVLTGEKVAIKIMDKDFLADEMPRVRMEIEAMKSVMHQNICQLYQVIETKDKIYMILEHCSGGELFDYIVDNEQLPESEARGLFRQVISAVAHVHDQGFVHRDLKPENLLFDEKQNLKLTDFGLCTPLQGKLPKKLDTCCGSPAYAAPELLRGKQSLGLESDLWSMGVLLYTLVCGYLPFEDSDIDYLYDKIKAGKYRVPEFLSAECATVIQKLLQVDVKSRATMKDLIEDLWVTKGFNKPLPFRSQLMRDIIDEDCVAVLGKFHEKMNTEMQRHIMEWDYDYLTATYLLLLNKKMKGKPVRLGTQRLDAAAKARMALKTLEPELLNGFQGQSCGSGTEAVPSDIKHLSPVGHENGTCAMSPGVSLEQREANGIPESNAHRVRQNSTEEMPLVEPDKIPVPVERRTRQISTEEMPLIEPDRISVPVERRTRQISTEEMPLVEPVAEQHNNDFFCTENGFGKTEVVCNMELQQQNQQLVNDQSESKMLQMDGSRSRVRWHSEPMTISLKARQGEIAKLVADNERVLEKNAYDQSAGCQGPGETNGGKVLQNDGLINLFEPTAGLENAGTRETKRSGGKAWGRKKGRRALEIYSTVHRSRCFHRHSKGKSARMPAHEQRRKSRGNVGRDVVLQPSSADGKATLRHACWKHGSSPEFTKTCGASRLPLQHKALPLTPAFSAILNSMRNSYPSGNPLIKNHLTASLYPSRSIDSQLNSLSVGEDWRRLPKDLVSGSVDAELSRLHLNSEMSNAALQKKTATSSIERSMDRLLCISTSRRKIRQPEVQKDFHNVYFANCDCPNWVLHRLKTTLDEQHVPFQEAGYKLRSFLSGGSNKVQLAFELEVVRLRKFSSVGVRCRRIRGNSWHYKRLCESILNEARV